MNVIDLPGYHLCPAQRFGCNLPACQGGRTCVERARAEYDEPTPQTGVQPMPRPYPSPPAWHVEAQRTLYAFHDGRRYEPVWWERVSP